MSEILDRNTIKALSVEQRQAIMKMLAKRPYTATEIAKISGKHVTTITQHLNVLEKSELVKKKDSTNKWVYYALTDRGERLFKPQHYTWIVVLSLSIVLMSIGVLRMFSPVDYGLMQATTMDANFEEKAAAPAMNAGFFDNVTKTNETDQELERIVAPPPTGPDVVAFTLIAMGIFGLAYVIYNHKIKSTVKL